MNTILKNIVAIGGLISTSSLSLLGADNAQNDYQYRDVPFNAVHCTDKFWSSRIETVRTVTVPFAFKKCEETGRIENFEIAAGRKEGRFRTTYPFDDSDVYKIMEGASFLLSVKPDKQLDEYMDKLIALIGEAQEADGYLYTNRTINNPPHPWIGKKRWENEWDNSHETYNAGHLYEAAVAHYIATGKRNLLDIAIKNADLLCETFRPGGLCIAPGHEVVEMGLVKLYRATGNKKYLELSRYFLESRGKSTRFDKNSSDIWRNGEYWQDHLPVREQREAVGHAVRATYLYCGMADIAALLQDKGYLDAIDAIWNNIVSKKMYVTGGIGSTSHGEAFGKNYELPNKSAYCETCAAIGNCMFNHRMFMLHGDSKYIDVLERSLYNGVLSGIDLSGDKFFYPNPLEVDNLGQERSLWFDCSCCPSNLSRFIPSVPGYVYATDDKSVYVNLYIANESSIKLNGNNIGMKMETEYPWDGKIKLTITPEKKSRFAMRIRIPGWARNEAVPSDLYSYTAANQSQNQIRVNGKLCNYRMEKGYAVIDRKWKQGDRIDISFDMQPKLVIANENVEDDRNKVSVECGPIVYCAEFADNGGSVSNIVVDKNTRFGIKHEPNLLNGINTLIGAAKVYSSYDGGKTMDYIEKPITLIPYYARSHRGLGGMKVWLPLTSEFVQKEYQAKYRIVDEILVGNSTSESNHNLQGEKTNTGGSLGWRDASDGGWFSYDLEVLPNEEMQLVLTYSSLDGGNRYFAIYADGVQIGEQKLRTETFNARIDRVYKIPAEITKGKMQVTIKLVPFPGNIAGGIWGCRMERVNL